MTPKIFISYRRDDTAAFAGHLCERLRIAYGRSNVFMDIDTIRLGSDFSLAIDREIKQSDLVLILIGAQWLSEIDESGHRRLDDSYDFVRLEATAALKHRKRIIPIYVNDAKPLNENDLPESLRPLARKHGEEIRNDKFDVDVTELIAKIAKLPDFTMPRKFRSQNVGRWIIGLGVIVTIVLVGAGYSMWIAR